MQAGSNVTLDASAAVPQEIRANDPRHLGNLTKNMSKINAQVSSDTKYDPTPPPRVDKNGKPLVENYTAELGASDTKLIDEKLFAIGALAAIVAVTILVIVLDPKLQSAVSQTQNGYVFLSVAALLCAITVLVVMRARYYNEIKMWYPRA